MTRPFPVNLTIVAVVVGVIGLGIWSVVHEHAERDYVRTHDCAVVETRPGYFTSSVSTSNGRTTVSHTWHGPRLRWSCVDGSQHWTDVI